MKNNKFDKDAGIFCVGIVLCAISVFAVGTLNQQSEMYKNLYNGCKNDPTLSTADCRCLAKCMEKNYKKQMFFNTDESEMCFYKCL